MRRFFLPAVFMLMTIVSCKDAKIAELIEGTWKNSTVTSYEDGTKSHQDEYVTYTKRADENGGTFTETTTGQEEFEEDEISGTYRWTCYIEGTWKIEYGTLYHHYSMSSLEVKVAKEDVDYKVDHSKAFQHGLESGLSSLFDYDYMFGTNYYLSENLYKELQKNTYTELFRYYKTMNKQYDEGLGVDDIYVNSSTLSYSTSEGTLTYHKTNDTVPSIK